MLNRHRTFVLALALAAFVFVVLCPATPTPNGVVKGQAALLLPAAAALSIIPAVALPGDSALYTPVRAPRASILELTCTRIC